MVEAFTGMVKEAIEKSIEQPKTQVEKNWDTFEETVEVEPTEQAKQEEKTAERWEYHLKKEDLDEVFNGRPEYDFDGKDFNRNPEQLNGILEGFKEDNWNNMDLDGKKEQIKRLSDYVNDVVRLENPPNKEYYNVPDEGNYGSYNPGTNTMRINEYTLDDPKEAVDTVAHESWHTYQHECADNPQSIKDYQYQCNFENYIRSDDDYEGYKKQLVEDEASAFAGQFQGAFEKMEGV